jgi:hypothetical protein
VLPPPSSSLSPRPARYHNLLMSIPTTLPRRALTIFFGQSLDTIADLLRGRVTDPALVAYRVVSRRAGGEPGWQRGAAASKLSNSTDQCRTSGLGLQATHNRCLLATHSLQLSSDCVATLWVGPGCSCLPCDVTK